MKQRSFFSLFLLSFILCTTMQCTVPVAYAQDDRIDIDIDIKVNGIDIFSTIKNAAKDGIRTAKKSINKAKNLAKNVARSFKKRVLRIKNKMSNLKRRLIKQKKKFTRLTKKILAIAQSGGDVPPSMGEQAGVSAGEILRLQHDVQLLRFELDQIKQQQQQDKIKDILDKY